MATYLVLQQRVLARHNRPHEITRRTYALGSAFMLLAAVAEAPPWRAETRSRWAMNASELAGAVYGGVVASGFNYTVMTWVNGAVGASVFIERPRSNGSKPLAPAMFARPAVVSDSSRMGPTSLMAVCGR